MKISCSRAVNIADESQGKSSGQHEKQLRYRKKRR